MQKQGANITIVDNGKDAIELIKKENFDIVLMDLQMPDVDGYKATRYIRQVMNNQVPIFAMTADALKGEAEKCIEAGMNGFISKPFEPIDLYRKILNVTNGKEKKDSLQEVKTISDMQRPIVDMNFLYEISDGDPGYITDVIDIFLGTMPDGLVKLENLVHKTEDWEATYKQAHFLKSSVSVIKVRDMFDLLGKIEMLAKNKTGKEEIHKLLAEVLAIFKEALPFLLAEKERQQQKQK